VIFPSILPVCAFSTQADKPRMRSVRDRREIKRELPPERLNERGCIFRYLRGFLAKRVHRLLTCYRLGTGGSDGRDQLTIQT
jgi:hypothetical protein